MFLELQAVLYTLSLVPPRDKTCLSGCCLQIYIYNHNVDILISNTSGRDREQSPDGDGAIRAGCEKKLVVERVKVDAGYPTRLFNE